MNQEYYITFGIADKIVGIPLKLKHDAKRLAKDLNKKERFIVYRELIELFNKYTEFRRTSKLEETLKSLQETGEHQTEIGKITVQEREFGVEKYCIISIDESIRKEVVNTELSQVFDLEVCKKNYELAHPLGTKVENLSVTDFAYVMGYVKRGDVMRFFAANKKFNDQSNISVSHLIEYLKLPKNMDAVEQNYERLRRLGEDISLSEVKDGYKLYAKSRKSAGDKKRPSLNVRSGSTPQKWGT